MRVKKNLCPPLGHGKCGTVIFSDSESSVRMKAKLREEIKFCGILFMINCEIQRHSKRISAVGKVWGDKEVMY